jgi:hypothetical protein
MARLKVLLLFLLKDSSIQGSSLEVLSLFWL